MGCEVAITGQLCGSRRDSLPELVIEAAPVRLQVSRKVSCTTPCMLICTHVLTFRSSSSIERYLRRSSI